MDFIHYWALPCNLDDHEMNTETSRQYHNMYIRLAIKRIPELRKSNSCVSSYAYAMASGNHKSFIFIFIFSIFCGSQSGNHPEDERAKFGYRSDPQKRMVDNLNNPCTYVLATPKNPVSKYGAFHVFLLGMCRTKRHLKRVSQQSKKPKNQFCVDAKFCIKHFNG